MNKLSKTKDRWVDLVKSYINSKKVYYSYFSRKGYELKIPVREIEFSENFLSELRKESTINLPNVFAIYDTSGEYGSNLFSDRDEKSINKVREDWLKNNIDLVEYKVGEHTVKRAKKGHRVTQKHYAKQGIITPEMEYVAYRESVEIEKNKEWIAFFWKDKGDEIIKTSIIKPEDICEAVAKGRVIIPANVNHPELEPMGIGVGLRTKINANIGNSSVCSDTEEEIEKLLCAIFSGADTVMDLSTGENMKKTRETIVRTSPVPIGTVPIYEALERSGGKPEDITWELYRDILIEQAEQGVDYFTIHSALLKEHLPLIEKRLGGIVSRGGAIIARWMKVHKKENFMYTHWDEICEILSEFDVAVSIGDGLRPGCIFDANDEAQFAELRVQAELAQRADMFDVQVMHEGPGHIPIQKVIENVEIQKNLCKNAPFYTLGPVVTDIALGYDHISSAIGACLIGSVGTDMLCYVTPKEHIGLPTVKDVRQGVIVYRISAHSADIAKGRYSAVLRDCLMTKARTLFLWKDQIALSMDPKRALEMFLESNKCPNIANDTLWNEQNYCTMCGPEFCAMKLFREAK